MSFLKFKSPFRSRPAGFEALCRSEPRFSHFAQSLFSQQGLGISRNGITKEEDAKLTASIAAFLHLLANHFLSPAAFKALEYLIRKFRCAPASVSRLLAF